MKHSIPLVIASLVMIFGVTSVVAAKEDEQQPSERTQEQHREIEHAQEIKDVREEVQEQVNEKRQTVMQKKTEVKERVKSQQVELDIAKCQRYEDRIIDLMPRLATGATSQKKVLDTMYARIVGFYEASILTIDDAQYQVLIDGIERAKATSETAIATMGQSKVTVDCQTKGVGSQLAEYRATVSDVKASLKDYRNSLVSLIRALKAASTSNSDASDGGTS